MDEIGAAIELGRTGDQAGARWALAKIWEGIGTGGDPFHRCTLAHYMADLQDSAESSLDWDLRALGAAAELTDDRTRAHHESLQVAGFLPSLHLNVADGYRRVGDFAAAREHLSLATEFVGVLDDDGYGQTIRGGIANVSAALDARSTERLPTN